MKKCSGGVANLKTDNISEDNSIINVIHVTKKFGQAVVLNDVNISFEKGKIHGLIGRNGCGKTTLLKLITGKEFPDKINSNDTKISLANNVNVGYLEQHSGLDKSSTVIEEMKSVFSYLGDTLNRMKEIENYMANHQDIDDALSSEYSKLSAVDILHLMY